MPEDTHLALRQADQARTDFAAIESDLARDAVDRVRRGRAAYRWHRGLLAPTFRHAAVKTMRFPTPPPLQQAPGRAPKAHLFLTPTILDCLPFVLRGAKLRAINGILARRMTLGMLIFCVSPVLPRFASAEEQRSPAVAREFQREYPCPSTGQISGACPGYVKDHIIPLACGGRDDPANLQWQTIPEAKAKDKWERVGCARGERESTFEEDGRSRATYNQPGGRPSGTSGGDGPVIYGSRVGQSFGGYATEAQQRAAQGRPALNRSLITPGQ